MTSFRITDMALCDVTLVVLIINDSLSVCRGTCDKRVVPFTSEPTSPVCLYHVAVNSSMSPVTLLSLQPNRDTKPLDSVASVRPTVRQFVFTLSFERIDR